MQNSEDNVQQTTKKCTCLLRHHSHYSLEPIPEKKRGVTYQPNEKMRSNGGRGAPRGCSVKKNCKLHVWFFEDHPNKKKKELFSLFFFKT
jgi:hypothetical protein